MAVASSSRSSSLNEHLKESTTNTANLGEGSHDVTRLEITTVSDFVTAAEVLPLPFGSENSAANLPPLLSQAPSHNAHIKYHSSTPPPRLHRNHLKFEQGSSSLPSSPHLSSISSKISTAFVELHAASRKKLLKQESSTSQPETSQLSQNSFLSHSETSSNVSIPQETATSSNATECENSVTVIAYDNLGFESDLYL